MPNPNLPINAKYNTYIGARYVPLMGGEWNIDNSYEPLVVVTYQGSSYTSNTFVPAGTDINNTTYWTKTGDYNAQVDQYRNETKEAVETVTNIGAQVNQQYENIVKLTPEIEKTAQNAIDSVNETSTNAVNEINTSTSQAITTLNNAVDTAETTIDNKTQTAQTTINQLSESAVNNINAASRTAVRDITETKSSSIQDLENSATTLNTTLNSSAAESLTLINTRKNDALNSIEGAREEAMAEISGLTPNKLYIRDLGNSHYVLLWLTSDTAPVLEGVTVVTSIDTLESINNPDCIHIVLGYSKISEVNRLHTYISDHASASIFTIAGWTETGTSANANLQMGYFNQTLEAIHTLSSEAVHVWTLTHAQLIQRDLYTERQGGYSRALSVMKIGTCPTWNMTIDVADNEYKITRFLFTADEENIRCALIHDTSVTFPIIITDTVPVMLNTYRSIIEFPYPFTGVIFPAFPAMYTPVMVSDGNAEIYRLAVLTLVTRKESTVSTQLQLNLEVSTDGLGGNTAQNSFSLKLHGRYGYFETTYKRIYNNILLGAE